jgi:hypothetical protein
MNITEKSLLHYDVKILLALLESLKGSKKFFHFLMDNGYVELAAWSNAVRGDVNALHWLFDNGYGNLGVLSNAIDGEKKAVMWTLNSKDEFMINFSAACRKDKDSIDWLRKNDLQIFILMVKEIQEILEVQVKDQMFWYKWK